MEGIAQICDTCKAARAAASQAKAEAAAQASAPSEPTPQTQVAAASTASTGIPRDVVAVSAIGGALVIGLVVWLFALGGMATVGIAGDNPAPAALVVDTPTASPLPPLAPLGYERGDCTFDIPEGEDVECGFLTVPQSRAAPDLGRARIPAAVFKSDSPYRQLDPVVYLDGGPGGNTLDEMPFIYDVVKEVAPDRDVIIFDQRGAGGSTPSLDCPEVEKVNYEILATTLTIDQRVVEDISAVKTCRDRLERAGVDPSFATSAENAADVNDLRIALGYEQWNLYGVSYGTKLALTVMRDHPEGVRSVILDSTYPLQTNLFGEIQTDFDRALSALFASCAADSFCSTTFPDLETVFYADVDELNRAPVQFGISVESGRTDLVAKIDGIWLSSLVFSAMYSEDLISLLPQLIFDIHGRHYGLVDRFVDGWFRDSEGVSVGMYYSVECAEEMPFVLRDAVLDGAKAHPHLAAFNEYNTKSLFGACDTWQAPPAGGIADEAVHSTIPTLVLAGEFDPITPPAWGQMVAGDLENSYFFQFPGIGHGAAFSDECPAGMAEAFIEDPNREPSASCLSGMDGMEWIAR